MSANFPRRAIVLDTETTGFNHGDGDRMVEIGCLELINLIPTGEKYHVYINPERDMPEGAFKVHGLSEEFLSDKPKFAEVADGFCDFVKDDVLVIHNAPFDMGFLNFELVKSGRPALKQTEQNKGVIDTLKVAKKRYPTGPNSLDALCRRFGIDNSNRTLHGALLDSELLAEVYMELMGGRQTSLIGKAAKAASGQLDQTIQHKKQPQRPKKLASLITEEELANHKKFVADEIGDDAIWNQ